MVMSVSAVISACQVAGLAEHHRLGALVVAAGPALHQVGGQRERRAREADQRHLAQRGDQQRHRVGDRRHLLGVQRLERPRRRRRCGSGGRSPGRRRARCPARCRRPCSGTTMSENRMAASTPCLRTGCRVISQTSSGVEAGVQHAVLGAQRAVLGQRASGLAHEPHRHAVRVAAGGSGQIRRLGQLTAGAHRCPCCHVPGRAARSARLRTRLREMGLASHTS